ncbi:MAG: sugar phosphate nucleotidyltransferase, partial [Bdellovibrionota bacterium]
TTKSLTSAIQDDSPGVQILSEPQGRNTAPCVYWAAREIAKKNPKGIMLVMPSDHTIPQLEKFKKTVSDAIAWAQSHDDLVTLGIKPDRPETGYGYLKFGVSVGSGAYRVDSFVEKPNLDKAKEFLKAGNFYWNGGMFVWRVDVILRAFDQYAPEMKKIWDANHEKVEAAYPHMTATSIDYAVMEKASNVTAFPLDCGWDDLGSWTSLENLGELLGAKKDSSVVMAGDLISIESTQNIIDAQGKLVALLGIQDLIVVHHGDVILVARKDRAQDIKLVVEQVKKLRPGLA